jgi:hypothetical protein
MSGHHNPSDVRLTCYQQQLVDRLQPLVARLDRAKVTAESGLRIEKQGNSWDVRLLVEARDERIPGLNLTAAQSYCVLGFAQSEQVECHSDPSSSRGLVDQVVELTERYLSGVTVVQHQDKRGRVIRIQYSFSGQAEGASAAPIGTSRYPFLFRRVDHTETLSFRFLKDEGAA